MTLLSFPRFEPDWAELLRLDEEEQQLMRERVTKAGWRPDDLEPGKWRKDYPGGYMVMKLYKAYEYETEHFCD